MSSCFQTPNIITVCYRPAVHQSGTFCATWYVHSQKGRGNEKNDKHFKNEKEVTEVRHGAGSFRKTETGSGLGSRHTTTVCSWVPPLEQDCREEQAKGRQKGATVSGPRRLLSTIIEEAAQWWWNTASQGSHTGLQRALNKVDWRTYKFWADGRKGVSSPFIEWFAFPNVCIPNDFVHYFPGNVHSPTLDIYFSYKSGGIKTC